MSSNQPKPKECKKANCSFTGAHSHAVPKNYYPEATEVGAKPTKANEKLGLPFGKMKTIKIAFDVDGTLRNNTTDTSEEPNQRIVELFKTLNHFKNTELYVWSGGGAEYALRFARLYGLPVKDSHCIGKIGAPPMDIAIDDIQDTAIAPINLIVKEK